jgi:MauM/NapG family ferredoxin protein
LTGLIAPSIIFRIDPLIMIMISVSERVLLPGMVFAFLMLIATLILGRFFCGWVCPLGTFNDGISSLRKKKRVPTDASNRKIRKIKYIVLGTIAFFALLGFQAAWFFDPLVIFARFVSVNFIPAITLGIDSFFIALIQRFELYGGVYDFYRSLKGGILGVHVYSFANSAMILSFLLCISLPVVLVSRIWCRMLCPLGALYALVAKKSWLERQTGECLGCQACRADCRMGAITDDGGYRKGECILCMDCVYSCPANVTSFGWRQLLPVEKPKPDPSRGGISRRDFLLLLFSSVSFLGIRNRHALGQAIGTPSLASAGVVRPPGSMPEDDFLARCIRCGNCMKVCPTNGLQPVMMEAGWEGVWTPQLVSQIGYCEFNCTLCGTVCPTGAIRKLTRSEKQSTKIGLAVVARNLCLPWAENKNCIVCEEHCPVSNKAIKLETIFSGDKKLLRPIVVKDLCIGCGICEKVCPLRPSRAIRVGPLTATGS